MIDWNAMDERERAVWSAMVASAFTSAWNWTPKDTTRTEMMMIGALNLVDSAVYELRELVKKGPYR